MAGVARVLGMTWIGACCPLYLFLFFGMSTGRVAAADTTWLAPAALAISPDASWIYVACSRANRILVVDSVGLKVARCLPLPAPPGGIAVDRDGKTLYVTCPGPRSRILAVDAARGAVIAGVEGGHTSMDPTLSPDGKTLFVCHRFEDDVGIYDLGTMKEICRVPVRREPVAAAAALDGRWLLVAHGLPWGKADAERVEAVVSVIDTGRRRVVDELWLPSGSSLVNDVAVSPDGRHAVVTHVLARFTLPTSQVERGLINANAMTLIDLDRMEVRNTVLLDTMDRGSANPWGAGWSGDGSALLVAISGGHEVSIVDFKALMEKLERLSPPLSAAARLGLPYSSAPAHTASDVPNDLEFLDGLRERRPLAWEDLGPRAVAVAGPTAYVANFFSDTLSVVRLAAGGPGPAVRTIPLGGPVRRTMADLGEMYFHDARLCHQQWQSCASCHPGDARADGFNWDLLNDGVGNPRNTKSLLLAFDTPPSMIMGVREDAAAAVRAGVRHILFTEQPERVYRSLDAYVRSLQPVPSPHLDRGRLSAAARRGRRLFESAATGCSGCHPAPLFTDLKSHDVGTGGRSPEEGAMFDTPTLVELWRTAPYLHDGSASLREVLIERNSGDRHGATSHLTADQVNDLAAYVQSL